MANIVKAALKSKHPRYIPIDPSTLTQVIPPHVEPGRLEARINEFYRKVESILQRKPELVDVDDNDMAFDDRYGDSQSAKYDYYTSYYSDRSTNTIVELITRKSIVISDFNVFIAMMILIRFRINLIEEVNARIVQQLIRLTEKILVIRC
jgi:hypothetical protein